MAACAVAATSSRRWLWGARACMAGRAYLYGLGAAGERRVDRVLGLLDADVRRTMALVGVSTIGELGRELVDPRS
jgi:L-lactate dehydrogenase (cytochrome)